MSTYFTSSQYLFSPNLIFPFFLNAVKKVTDFIDLLFFGQHSRQLFAQVVYIKVVFSLLELYHFTL